MASPHSPGSPTGQGATRHSGRREAGVGEGVWEMREVFGPGWRLYYTERSGALIIMLGGGDKSSQTRDIELAKKMATELLHEQDKNTTI